MNEGQANNEGRADKISGAWGVIAVFIRYLQRRGLEPFGYYRIVLSALVLWLALKG